jgi:predicted transcriptional regulator YdeE
MAEIIKTYREPHPAMRLVGKRYTDADRVNGMFGVKWGEWHQNHWFQLLEQLGAPDGVESGAVGYMRDVNGVFEYWIGMFTPAGTAVPDGFSSLDFDAGYLGVCHIFGKESDIYCKEPMCAEHLQASGYTLTGCGCMERYIEARFGRPDAEGRIILDICFFVL